MGEHEKQLVEQWIESLRYMNNTVIPNVVDLKAEISISDRQIKTMSAEELESYIRTSLVIKLASQLVNEDIVNIETDMQHGLARIEMRVLQE